jgi:hypothetical protein
VLRTELQPSSIDALSFVLVGAAVTAAAVVASVVADVLVDADLLPAS